MAEPASQSGDRTIAAIVLAAGSSRRFGADNKLLAEVDGEALIRRVVRCFLQSMAGQVFVVTGHQKAEIESALAGLPVTFAHNPRHLEGMGHTVAAGVRALPPDVRCALITPGDLPGLTPALVDRLVKIADVAGPDRIVFPALPTGEQRNPVLWPRRFFAELAALSGDTGARGVIRTHAALALPVAMDTPDVFLDIDKPEDLAAWRKRKRKIGDGSGGTP